MSGLPMPLPTVEKLAKICGLLGSDHDGERSAAAHQASLLLRRHGLTWREVIERGLVRSERRQRKPKREAPTAAAPPKPDWRALVRDCLCCQGRLSKFEIELLRVIWQQPSISPKQRRVLNEIATKLREAGR